MRLPAFGRMARSTAFGAMLVVAVVALTTVLAWQITTTIGLLAPARAAPVFCGPTALHTMDEPPESRLTRDYVVLKLLLLDPADHFAQVHRLYEGSLRAPRSAESGAWLAKRSERGKLFTAATPTAPGFGSLRNEALRLDREQGTSLALRIEDALARRDRVALDAEFREMFVLLIDELLASIQLRVADSTAVARVFQYVRHYYVVSLQAHLAVKSSANSMLADAALNGMSRALDEVKNGGTFSRKGFDTLRHSFVRSLDVATRGGGDAKPAHSAL
jgi:hypothetical protein